MKKSIILEGPNGSGKTTLGLMLSDILDMEYIHAGPSPGGTPAAFKACIDQYTHLTRGVVMDRCTPISRPVYESNISGEMSWLQEWAWAMNEQALFVLCTGVGDFTNKPYYPEGHYEKILQDQEKIRNNYADVIELVDYITYDWEVDSLGSPESLLEGFRNG